MYQQLRFFSIVLMGIAYISSTNGEVVQLVSGNLADVLGSHELVMINFYADWCRFSQQLKPIFEEAAKAVKNEFPEEGKVAMTKVNCDVETSISSQFHVNKYPTLKLIRYGELVKKEYRGQRSADAIRSFVAEQLKDPVIKLEHSDEINAVERKKRVVYGVYDSATSNQYKVFHKVASKLRDDCTFYSAVGDNSEEERTGNQLVFRGSNADSDQVYQGSLDDDVLLSEWIGEKCRPIVREITFENAEELTEEGLPFLILFHNPDDVESPEKFKRLVTNELMAEKSSVNFLMADGNKFSHPLYHLGKTTKDLPILAIDSFRHMYLWKHSVEDQLESPGMVKQFIADLHSGKLHREFHHGPDSGQAQIDQKDSQGQEVAVAGHEGHKHIQQQMVIHGNGRGVQVVRVVQLGGNQGPIDLAGNLAALQGRGGFQLDLADSSNDFAAAMKDQFKQMLDGIAKLEDDDNDDYDVEVIKPEDTDDNNDTYNAHHRPDESAQDVRDNAIDNSDDHADRVKRQASNDEGVTAIVHTRTYAIPTSEPPSESEEESKAPPESMFKRLFPSDTRYTILKKDEL